MSTTGPRALRLHPADDVAVLIDPAAPGDTILAVTARDAVPAGHKIALRALAAGDAVRKYGQPIGLARHAIAAGEHVHEHNLALPEHGIARDAVAAADTPARHAAPSGEPSAWFDGYRRADGTVGTRNTIAVIASVNCSATVVRRIARAFEDRVPDGVDAVVPYTHAGGCGMAADGEAVAVLERTLTGYARHPNVGGALLVGLGCEVAQIEGLLARHGLVPGERLRTLVIQDAGGTAAAIEAGVAIVAELVALAARDRRERCPASELVLGLQCGGSDGWSGITANPALGVAADLLVTAGGTVLLSETPEIVGAEHLLYARATTPAVAAALAERVAWWQDYATSHGASLDNNPSPGNKAGGLTTIYEKSLGAIAKAGGAPLGEVIGYAARPRGRGLVFMDSPGYDPCSATGQIASGANLLAFTTGRGSVFGAQPTPCLKLASNAALAQRMRGDMDVDCSVVLGGVSLDQLGRDILATLLAVASGQPTKSELNGLGEHEFVPWRLGAWL